MEEIDLSISSDDLHDMFFTKSLPIKVKTVSKVQKELLSMIDKNDDHRFPSLSPEKNIDKKYDFFFDDMESETDTIISAKSRHIDSPYISLSSTEDRFPPVRLRLSSSLSSLNLDSL